MRKWIYGAVALVLAGLFWYSTGNVDKDTPEAAYKELSKVREKLEKAGTARVEFTASLRGGKPFGEWQGTSVVRLKEPSWDTSYTKMAGTGTDGITARRVHVGGADYYTSPDLVAPDGRPWWDASRTVQIWGDQLSDPQLDVADITTWLPFFGGLDIHLADSAKEGDHKYRLECMSGRSVCPPPFGTRLDRHFDQTSPPILTAELDDDGRLVKLDVECVLTNSGKVEQDDVALRPKDAYYVKASFKLSGFGDEATIQAPADAEITASDRVVLKGRS
ncbi:hypothetical protein [Actinoplanes sp. NPDC020271]|uniref:hypothetical protein n=1 Tax=Actinoplanes sp. NPDC020271 TaxID=3363896 RepID=UPI0037A1FB23